MFFYSAYCFFTPTTSLCAFRAGLFFYSTVGAKNTTLFFSLQEWSENNICVVGSDALVNASPIHWKISDRKNKWIIPGYDLLKPHFIRHKVRILFNWKISYETRHWFSRGYEWAKSITHWILFAFDHFT